VRLFGRVSRQEFLGNNVEDGNNALPNGAMLATASVKCK